MTNNDDRESFEKRVGRRATPLPGAPARDPNVPSWWDGDAEAAASSLAAARALGLRVPGM